MLLPRGTSVAEALLWATLEGLARYICMSIDVEAMAAGRVLFPDEDAEVAVALAAESPVTMTAVPVAATPPTRPLAVLLAYGAFVEAVIAVKLEPPVVRFEVEFESPVAKIEVDEVVALATLVVTFVAVALLNHVKGGCDEGVLYVVEGVLYVELCADVVNASAVVLGGYAVLPSTLVGMGRVVMLVKYDFLVADVFGIEVIGDVVVSCLGRTAALTETAARAIELMCRNFILGSSVVLCV
jgi:hypothetical protein